MLFPNIWMFCKRLQQWKHKYARIEFYKIIVCSDFKFCLFLQFFSVPFENRMNSLQPNVNTIHIGVYRNPEVLNLGPWPSGVHESQVKNSKFIIYYCLMPLISSSELWKSRVCLDPQMGMFEFIPVAIRSRHYIPLST